MSNPLNNQKYDLMRAGKTEAEAVQILWDSADAPSRRYHFCSEKELHQFSRGRCVNCGEDVT